MDGTQTFAPMVSRSVALDPQEWNIVLAGLGELPLKISRNLFEKLMRELQAQERN